MNKLRELRTDKNWTMRQLSDASGVSTNTIVRIEAGKKCEPRTAKKLADALGVDWRVLNDLIELPNSKAA